MIFDKIVAMGSPNGFPETLTEAGCMMSAINTRAIALIPEDTVLK